MGGLSIWHWLIVGAVVLIVFGGKGKISDIMGDVAKGINFALSSSRPTKDDFAILRYLSAVEQIESDLWAQYAELGGAQAGELPGLSGANAPYTMALQNLDSDMPQYIHDNPEDELPTTPDAVPICLHGAAVRPVARLPQPAAF